MKPMRVLTQQDTGELLTAPYCEPIRLSGCWALRLRVDLENGLEEDQFYTFNEHADAQLFLALLPGMQH